jgi:hypothetical protein
MDDKAAVLVDVCAALSGNQLEKAAAILHERYPFVPLVKGGRRYSIGQMLRVFVRDGFVDRYSGTRLVCAPALRLISMHLPGQFPFQTNWRTDVCHFAFWDLAPTIDHIAPVSRGGADDERNWATTSMLRNSAKANFTLDELGWPLRPTPGGMKDWDGLWVGLWIKRVPTAPSEMIPICGRGSRLRARQRGARRSSLQLSTLLRATDIAEVRDFAPLHDVPGPSRTARR